MRTFFRNNRLTDVKVHDEIFMLDMDTDKYYALNATASCIWNMLLVPVSIGELHQKLIDKYNVEDTVARNALNEFLKMMLDRKMIYEINDHE